MLTRALVILNVIGAVWFFAVTELNPAWISPGTFLILAAMVLWIVEAFGRAADRVAEQSYLEKARKDEKGTGVRKPE